MEDKNNLVEITDKPLVEDSLYHKYQEFLCFIPGYGAFIPFVSTKDALTSQGVYSMIMGTNYHDDYEQ